MTEDSYNLSNDFSAYLDGELTPEEALRVEQAVAADAELARQLEQLRATRQMLRSIPRASAPSDLTDRIMAQAERTSLVRDRASRDVQPTTVWWARYVAVAAVLVAAVGIGVLITETMQVTRDSRNTISRHEQEKAAPAPTARPDVDGDAIASRDLGERAVGDRARSSEKSRDDRSDERLDFKDYEKFGASTAEGSAAGVPRGAPAPVGLTKASKEAAPGDSKLDDARARLGKDFDDAMARNGKPAETVTPKSVDSPLSAAKPAATDGAAVYDKAGKGGNVGKDVLAEKGKVDANLLGDFSTEEQRLASEFANGATVVVLDVPDVEAAKKDVERLLRFNSIEAVVVVAAGPTGQTGQEGVRGVQQQQQNRPAGRGNFYYEDNGGKQQESQSQIVAFVPREQITELRKQLENVQQTQIAKLQASQTRQKADVVGGDGSGGAAVEAVAANRALPAAGSAVTAKAEQSAVAAKPAAPASPVLASSAPAPAAMAVSGKTAEDPQQIAHAREPIANAPLPTMPPAHREAVDKLMPGAPVQIADGASQQKGGAAYLLRRTDVTPGVGVAAQGGPTASQPAASRGEQTQASQNARYARAANVEELNLARQVLNAQRGQNIGNAQSQNTAYAQAGANIEPLVVTFNYVSFEQGGGAAAMDALRSVSQPAADLRDRTLERRQAPVTAPSP